MKARVPTIVLVFLLVFSAVLVQAPGIKADSFNYWAKSYEGTDAINDVKVLSDGSIIAVGYTSSFGPGGNDALVIKLNPDGSIAWARTYRCDIYDRATAVAVADNGDIIVAGWTESFGAGYDDAWVLRLDANGNIKWQKTYGGRDHDDARAVAIADNGDIIVAGRTWSFGAGRADVWVLRLDENGNVKWQKTYGGSGRDGFWGVNLAIADNGDIIVASSTESFGTETPHYSNVWVLRLDANGNIKWQKTYGGRSNDHAHAVAIADNGDIIVASYTYSFGAGEGDFWVLRLDTNGNVKWQKTYGGENEDVAYAVALADNGDIIVAGSTVSVGGWVLRLDENGDIKWQKAYRSDPHAVALAPTGDIIVAGGALVLRLPPDGDLPGFSGDTNAKITIPNPGVMDSQAEIVNSSVTPQDSQAYSNPVELTVRTFYGSATLTINSTPSGAEVYIDGEYKGTTPLAVQLYSGTHTIKLTKQDYENYTTTITLIPGESKVLNITLTPTFGFLTVYSDPSGAKVYVDGSYIGDTPIENYKLSTGEHTIKLVKENYADYVREITIELGKTTKIEATLTSNTKHTTTNTHQGTGGICGPAAIIGLSVIPVLLRRKR
ncbi:PEGA domain-containing protein [Thermococcus pacificus]|uniref:PEGA domain-containing protein n=1 Tax=Thermococcus pacificus TaxID=71998 RepID=UPI0018DF7094|nr:PEGA domain-containing protein [Thermococcus pacificus]